MVRRTLLALVLSTIAIVAWATVAGAASEPVAVQVPRSAGLMPAAEAPPVESSRSVAPVLESAGLVLLLGGAVVVARSWVSTAEPV